MKFRDQSGFSLLEMMIVAGLIGVLAVAFSSMILVTKKGMRSTEVYSELVLLTSNVLQITQNDALCAQAFSSVQIPNPATLGTSPVPLTVPLSLGSSVIAQVNTTTPPPTGVTVQSMAFNQRVATLPQTFYGTTGPLNSSIVQFEMKGVQRSDPTNAAATLPWTKDFYLTIMTDATGAIKSCFGGLTAATPSSWSCEVWNQGEPPNCGPPTCPGTTFTSTCTAPKKIVFANCGSFSFSINPSDTTATCTIPTMTGLLNQFTANLTVLCCS